MTVAVTCPRVEVLPPLPQQQSELVVVLVSVEPALFVGQSHRQCLVGLRRGACSFLAGLSAVYQTHQ